MTTELQRLKLDLVTDFLARLADMSNADELDEAMDAAIEDILEERMGSSLDDTIETWRICEEPEPENRDDMSIPEMMQAGVRAVLDGHRHEAMNRALGIFYAEKLGAGHISGETYLTSMQGHRESYSEGFRRYLSASVDSL